MERLLLLVVIIIIIIGFGMWWNEVRRFGRNNRTAQKISLALLGVMIILALCGFTIELLKPIIVIPIEPLWIVYLIGFIFAGIFPILGFFYFFRPYIVNWINK